MHRTYYMQDIDRVLSPYMSDVLICPTSLNVRQILEKKCPYMSDVLKCPTLFWKKCPYMSDVLKCPTRFLKKCPYMSDITKCPLISFPIILICPPALHICPISLTLTILICRLHIYLPICPPNQESVRLYMHTLVGGGGVGGVLHALKKMK